MQGRSKVHTDDVVGEILRCAMFVVSNDKSPTLILAGDWGEGGFSLTYMVEVARANDCYESI